MENVTISKFENDAVQEKKLDNYQCNMNNFLAGQEMTVTVTLGEYRELVKHFATSDLEIKTANSKAYDSEQAMKKAQAEAERLKAENYDLQNKVMELQMKISESAVQDGENPAQEKEAADV